MSFQAFTIGTNGLRDSEARGAGVLLRPRLPVTEGQFGIEARRRWSGPAKKRRVTRGDPGTAGKGFINRPQGRIRRKERQMKRTQLVIAALVLGGTTAIGYAASQGGGMDMDCDKMMSGNKGEDHAAMKGGDMSKHCMEMMKEQMDMGDKSAGKTHHGSGVVQSVDAAAGTVTVKHGAIASAGWPAMTMSFPVQDKKTLDNVKPGQKVDFAFTQQGSRNVITSIK